MMKDTDKNETLETVVPWCEWKEKYLALERRVSEMQKEMDELKEKVKKNKSEVSTHCKHFYKEETATKDEIKSMKAKLEILSNVVIQMEDKLNETNNKLINASSNANSNASSFNAEKCDNIWDT